mmetsp:Transcript_107511/g.272823  ORF Transcript_107511/g.272823 Transcript_107511/m.272823 type:complete len:227 (-) Transcript_107511:517-1197(-)
MPRSTPSPLPIGAGPSPSAPSPGGSALASSSPQAHRNMSPSASKVSLGSSAKSSDTFWDALCTSFFSSRRSVQAPSGSGSRSRSSWTWIAGAPRIPTRAVAMRKATARLGANSGADPAGTDSPSVSASGASTTKPPTGVSPTWTIKASNACRKNDHPLSTKSSSVAAGGMGTESSAKTSRLTSCSETQCLTHDAQRSSTSESRIKRWNIAMQARKPRRLSPAPHRA